MTKDKTLQSLRTMHNHQKCKWKIWYLCDK